MRKPDSAVVTAASAEAMRALGAALARVIETAPPQSIVIALEGELGAGKTTLAGGLLNALGVSGAIRSPTYTLIEPYEAGDRHIYHLDLYRLTDPGEVENLGVRDLLASDAVLLIEWAERGETTLPPSDLRIAIRYPAGSLEGGRTIELTALSATGLHLLSAVKQQ